MTYDEYIYFMSTYMPTTCPCSERWFDNTYVKDMTLEHYIDLWQTEQALLRVEKTVKVPDDIVRKVKL